MKNDQNKPAPGETVAWRYIDAAGKWRYRLELNSASSSFKYRAVLERWAGGDPLAQSSWEKIGANYVSTRWGAGWWARRTRRRHERRFGGN